VLLAAGTVASGNAGRSVALLGGGAFPAALLLGAPQGDQAGVPLSGGVTAHVYGPMGLTVAAGAKFGGEVTRPDGQIGLSLYAGTLNGAPGFVVGGYDGSSLGVDTGSAYAIDLLP
jgi:hypothetical protein